MPTAASTRTAGAGSLSACVTSRNCLLNSSSLRSCSSLYEGDVMTRKSSESYMQKQMLGSESWHLDTAPEECMLIENSESRGVSTYSKDAFSQCPSAWWYTRGIDALRTGVAGHRHILRYAVCTPGNPQGLEGERQQRIGGKHCSGRPHLLPPTPCRTNIGFYRYVNTISCICA